MGRILLVEEKEDLAGAYSLMLAVGNHGTKRVSNGTEALKCLGKKRHFDLVITNSKMPEINSGKLLLKLKAMRPNVPIIMITSNDIPLGEHGADVVLPKPISLANFLGNVNLQLKRH